MMKNYQPNYFANYGKVYCGDSRVLLEDLPEKSVNLVMTSPPFALQREKAYGNVSQNEYVDWLTDFAKKVFFVLKDDGSFVLDLGGAYQKGQPARSLHNFRVLIKFCDELGFILAEDFYWFNPSKLPSPIEWVNKRKVRAKDAVNTVWWFSKTAHPKADITQVLDPYSHRMVKLLEDQEKYYQPKQRPSGHDISNGFGKDNGGAIPSNLLAIANSESSSRYLKLCRDTEVKPHPARFPKELPSFFIKFLTSPNDLVLDIFSGSNTTGRVAENLGRRWLSFDINLEYVAASAFRFVDTSEDAKKVYSRIIRGENNIDLSTSRLIELN